VLLRLHSDCAVPPMGLVVPHQRKPGCLARVVECWKQAGVPAYMRARQSACMFLCVCWELLLLWVADMHQHCAAGTGRHVLAPTCSLAAWSGEEAEVGSRSCC
jgi:hypothetical protein